jgi:chromosomal replication initiation ATPase DnaA
MEVPDSKVLAPDTETIIETVCKFYNIGRDKLFAIKRGAENEPRHVAIYLIRTVRGEPLLRIGALFNLKKHSSVSSAVGRIPKKWAKCILFDDRLRLLNKLFLSCYGFAEKPYQKEFSHVQRPEYKKRS